MSDLRKRFERETSKTVGEIGIYECSSCGNDEVEAETWNDNYVFWLEKLANGVSDSHEQALPINIVSNRRELLIDFLVKYRKSGFNAVGGNEEMVVDKYLKKGNL